MQSKKNAAIIVLAILVVALAILLYLTNADKNRLADTSAGYIPPADRVATFDMDGTIICEKAPVYIDTCLTLYRVLDDPDYSASEEERAAMQQLRDAA